MNPPTLTCENDRRRALVQTSRFFGLDYLEVSEDQRTLTVCFLGRAPPEITVAHLHIEGGERITDLQVTGVAVQRADDAALDDTMTVTVDHPGDFSTYRLKVRALNSKGRPLDAPMAGFDPRYASVEFNFKIDCPSKLDCQSPQPCPPPQRLEPEINTLAKDYASFRQLILDRLAVIMPAWRESHVPDIGIALVEVLAYVGDHLSYYQDAVATEAYLATSRQRISVRRHARLVDYAMHDGCNARTWLCLHPSKTYELRPAEISFLAGLDQISSLANKTILRPDDLTGLPADAYDVFEPLVEDPTKPITLHPAHREIQFYTWDNDQCCLPAGATQAVLLDPWEDPSTQQKSPGKLSATKLVLLKGDVLIFEEVIGPGTGNPADADPTRRWAVRLIRVTPLIDELIRTKDGRPTALVEIEWAAADALPFPFYLSTRLPAPDCRVVGNLSVARGNVMLIDHGRTIRPSEDLGVVEKIGETGNCACEGSVIEMNSVPGVFRPTVEKSPLTFHEPLDGALPAEKMLRQNPRAAVPAIVLSSIPPSPDGAAPLFAQGDLQNATTLARKLHARTDPAMQLLYSRLSAATKNALSHWEGTGDPKPALLDVIRKDLCRLLEMWLPQRDLLESESTDAQFVAEMDDDGRAHLRFGDGVCGRRPEAGTGFLARYRIGNGHAGNVGADRITKIMFQLPPVGGLTFSLRNPLAAFGGTEPEPVAEVKLFAPDAFKKVLERAITAGDYAVIAERNPRLQQASAELRWTGSWYEALVAIDPLGSETPDATLLRQVAGGLNLYRRIGHDLSVSTARYVPLEIALTVCVLPHTLRGHAESALLDIFSNRERTAGKRGFFHPDNQTFGDGVYLSQIIAAAQAVAGVQSVKATRFQRQFELPNNELSTGVLPLAPMEIAQLDNDPNFPEHGTLTLNLRGGR